MTIDFTKKFRRQYQRLPDQIQRQFDQRLQLFLTDQTSPQLRVHPLKGKFAGYWSLNVNGDIRALYLQRGETMIIFALIGSHSELYG